MLETMTPTSPGTGLDNVTLSSGRVYDETLVVLDEDGSAWPSPGTQAWPTAAQANELSSQLQSRGVCKVVSIGCGEGAFEAMLERRNVAVTSVDLDVLSDPSRYKTMRRFCTCIRRVRPDALYQIDDAASTALCFFWGRALPWREYLRYYPQAPVVCIIGEPGGDAEGDCATCPSADALDGEEGWSCCFRGPVRTVHGGSVLSVYSRATLLG